MQKRGGAHGNKNETAGSPAGFRVDHRGGVRSGGIVGNDRAGRLGRRQRSTGERSPAGGEGHHPADHLGRRGGVGKELQELVLDKINAEQAEFEIVHEPAPADYYTKVQTSLAGGTGADLIWLSQEYIAGYASRGALLDITDTLAAIDAPAAKLDSYFPDIIKTAVYQDKVYGLPWISQPVLLYYNPALFDAAGIAYPDDTWDWAKFMEAATAMTKDTDGDGAADQCGFTANGWPPIQMFIWQAGGEVISDDRLTSPIDSAEAIAGAEFYANIIYNPDCCPSEATIAEQGFSELFRAGKVAMFVGGAADTFEGLDVVGASVVPHAKNRRRPSPGRRRPWSTRPLPIRSRDQGACRADRGHPSLEDRRPAAGPRQRRDDHRQHPGAVEGAEGRPDRRDDRGRARTCARSTSSRARPSGTTCSGSEFQDPLYHDKGTAADLAAAIRPKLEALLK